MENSLGPKRAKRYKCVLEVVTGVIGHAKPCITIVTHVSYCMVCVYVREDNTRALASGLSPVYTHSHTITALLHPYCEIFDLEHWNITQRCNNCTY